MLYHFTSCDAALKIILTDNLRFSKSINLDDPFERWRCRNYSRMPPAGYDSGPDAKYYRHFNSLVNSTNVLCFFDSEDGKKETVNPLVDLKMWSHYGKNHRGSCLIFDKEKTIASFVDNVKDGVSDFGRVEYNDLKTYEPVFMSPFDTKEYSDIIFKKLFHNLFFNKSKYYSNENEFRFAVNNGKPDCSFAVSSKIKKVIIAENAREEDVKSIIRLCQLIKIEVGKMIVSDDKLEYTKIAGPYK